MYKNKTGDRYYLLGVEEGAVFLLGCSILAVLLVLLSGHVTLTPFC